MLLSLLIPGIAFILWYVSEQWNTALRDLVILDFPFFFSSSVYAYACARTRTLPAPHNGSCTVTVFH